MLFKISILLWNFALRGLQLLNELLEEIILRERSSETS